MDGDRMIVREVLSDIRKRIWSGTTIDVNSNFSGGMEIVRLRLHKA